MGGGKRIAYLYDGAGRRLQKINYLNSSPVTTTDYIANFVYINNDIGVLRHEFGHILQDRVIGTGIYYPIIGLPSLISGGINNYDEHMRMPFELDANQRAYKFFGEPRSDINKGGWDFNYYPIKP